MKLKKGKHILLLVMMVILILSLSGCGKSEGVKENIDNKYEVNTEKLLEYKNSYVTEASKVGNIISNLPGSKYYEGFEIETSNIPYEISIDYNNFEESDLLEPITEVMKKNSLILFSLIKNVDIINFNINQDDIYTYEREELIKAYGEELGIDLEEITERSSNLNNFLNKEIN